MTNWIVFRLRTRDSTRHFVGWSVRLFVCHILLLVGFQIASKTVITRLVLSGIQPHFTLKNKAVSNSSTSWIYRLKMHCVTDGSKDGRTNRKGHL